MPTLLPRRPVAAYQDLCLDATDSDLLAAFWGPLLGLVPERLTDGRDIVELRDPAGDPRRTVWVNGVPEPRSVKHRVHLDVRAPLADVLALGARVLDDTSFPWAVVADPEGGELCVFPPRADVAPGLMEVVVDCADPAAQAAWWGSVLGVDAQHDTEHGFSFLEGVPGAPFEHLVLVPVPEPKTVKNRVHFDVVLPDLSDLLAAGATLLVAEGDESQGGLGWSVMADPEGNEFCAFVGPLG